MTFTGAVGGTLALGATSITAASVVHSSTLVGNSTYAITGNATFGGAVSGITNLSVSGTSAINANITTTGTQGYTGNATLGAGVTLATTNNNITFGGTLDSDSSTARALTVDVGTANITFTGAVGGSQGLGNISLTSTGTTTFSSTVVASSLTQNSSSGTTAINGASISTTGTQSFGNAVTLGATSPAALQSRPFERPFGIRQDREGMTFSFPRQASVVRASLSDPSGREIWNGTAREGASELRWDRKADGDPVQSGIYFLRLSVNMDGKWSPLAQTARVVVR